MIGFWVRNGYRCRRKAAGIGIDEFANGTLKAGSKSGTLRPRSSSMSRRDRPQMAPLN
jgi:hypothetical protein